MPTDMRYEAMGEYLNRKKKPALSLGNAGNYDVPAVTAPAAAPVPGTRPALANPAVLGEYMQRPAPAPAPVAPPQAAQTVQPMQPQGGLGTRERMLAGEIERTRYLQQKGAQFASMGLSPAVAAQVKAETPTANVGDMVNERHALRDEMRLAEYAMRKPREVLTPSDNRAVQQDKTADLMKQIAMGEYGKAGDPGYQRALESFSLRGATEGPMRVADEYYNRLGSDITKRQTAGAEADRGRIADAMGEYVRHASSRLAGEQYAKDMTTATRDADVNAKREQAAVSGSRAALAQAMNEPEYIAAMKRASLAGAKVRAEQGELGLDQTRGDIEMQRRDLAGARLRDENVEKLYPAIVDLNSLSDSTITSDDLPRVAAMTQGVDSLMARLELLPPEAQAHYRRRILTELGNPSLAEFIEKSKAKNSLSQWLINNTIGAPFNQKGREAVGRMENTFTKLRGFLYPTGSPT